MTTTTNVQGTCDARFRAVEDAFRENFEHFGEVGASLSVVIDGKPVVDIWGGHADAARTSSCRRRPTPWAPARATLVTVAPADQWVSPTLTPVSDSATP
jgi:hypothetical protein